MSFQVRPATRDDADALASLRPYVHDKHARAHPDIFKFSELGAARREAETWLARPDMRVLLAVLDGEPVGYLMATVSERPDRELMHARRVLYVDQIALKDTVRARGHGKALLAAGVALARELGLPAVELEVWAFNTDARAFFRSQGFGPSRERLVRAVE